MNLTWSQNDSLLCSLKSERHSAKTESRDFSLWGHSSFSVSSSLLQDFIYQVGCNSFQGLHHLFHKYNRNKTKTYIPEVSKMLIPTVCQNIHSSCRVSSEISHQNIDWISMNCSLHTIGSYWRNLILIRSLNANPRKQPNELQLTYLWLSFNRCQTQEMLNISTSDVKMLQPVQHIIQLCDWTLNFVMLTLSC